MAAQVVSPSRRLDRLLPASFAAMVSLLIINAGGGYHILLAGLSQIDVQLGQFVLAGEPGGRDERGAQSCARRRRRTMPRALYVEFRKDRRPIDPDPGGWS